MASDSETPELPSRAKLRRAQRAQDDALWKIAEQLVGLREAIRARLDLDEALGEAADLAAGIPAGTGRRRQMRLVVQLLREGDSELVRRALNPGPGQHRPAAPSDRAAPGPADAQADSLIQGGDSALQAWMEAHPRSDRSQLRQWLRTLRTAAPDKPLGPAARKARKALLQYLQGLEG